MHFGSIDVLTQIQGQAPAMNTAEKALADFIIGNVGEVVQMTIEELAARSKTSYSTVCRFCQRLGFDGYKQFKKRLTGDMINNSPQEMDFAAYELISGESVQQICEKTFHLFSGILKDCASLLNLEVLESAVSTILGARMLYIIGAGASAASAMYAHTQLLRLGIPCSAESDPTVYQMKSALMSREDVLLAFSSSGRTSSVVEAALGAKEAGAQVISISDYCVSPLQKCSDFNLYTTARNAGKHLHVDMPLTIGQIAIIDIVYSCCSTTLGDKGRELYQRTKRAADLGKKSM